MVPQLPSSGQWRAPADECAHRGGSAMPIFYPGPDIRITDRALELPGGLRVRIPQRELVKVVTPPGGFPAVRTYCSTGAAGLAILLVVPGDNHTLGVVSAVLVMVTVVELARRRRGARPRQELWTDVGGRFVRLYSSQDPIVFGQVRR